LKGSPGSAPQAESFPLKALFFCKAFRAILFGPDSEDTFGEGDQDMQLDNTEFLKAIPKSDLHVHLDGSLRLESLIDLAKSRKVELPSYSDDGLRDLVFKDRYANLVEYLKGFSYTTAVLQDEEALERAGFELARDNQEEGVRYLEVRFAPQLHLNRDLSMEQVLESVNRGLKRARDEFNSRIEVASGKEPPFYYGIVVCALRSFDENTAFYFRRLLQVHRFTPKREIGAMASLGLARAAVRIRRTHDIPIVGFDLAGQEAGYPALYHREAYSYVHKHFLPKTVHAGEAYGPESIFQAITDLYADRIGHGCHLFSTDLIQSSFVEDREAYVEELSQYIADRRVTVESCLTSNVQTIPEMADLKDHAVARMLDHRMSVTFCTDNRLVSNTTVTKELELAVKSFRIDAKRLRDVVITGFKRSFFPGTYAKKRYYVRQIINYYDAVVGRFKNSNKSPGPSPGGGDNP
jgi:adenosine deaminase